MSIKLDQTKGLIHQILTDGQVIALASRGVKIWNAELCFWRHDFELYCIADDLQTIANICVNPRVAFTLSDSTCKSSLQGTGIAHFIEEIPADKNLSNGARIPEGVFNFLNKDARLIRIVPYRFILTELNPEGKVQTIIEKRRLEWTEVEAAGQENLPGKRKVSGRIQFWMKAMRSISFWLSAFPVAVGAAYAFVKGFFNPELFLLSLFGGILVHAGVNLISDYNDFKKGIDTTDALSSHIGVLVNESTEPEKLLMAAIIAFTAATFLGGVMVGLVGWSILLFGLVGITGGFFYTGGPVSYKYIGLGEFIIAFLMGPLMVEGAYFVQTGRVGLVAFVISIPVGLLVGSVTLANNLRDVQDDKRARITTLPMNIGIKRAKSLYYLMIILPYLIVGATVAADFSLYPLLLVVLSIPKAVKALEAMRKTGDTAEDFRAKAHIFRYPLNSIKLHFQFSIMLTIGCLISAFIK